MSNSSVLPTVEPLAEFQGRVVTLCDGRPGLRGGVLVDIRKPTATSESVEPGGDNQAQGPAASSAAPSATSPRSQPFEAEADVLDFIASSEIPDRYEEIISATGWRLENYRRNPVFQNAHQYGDVIFTLGKALLTEVRLEGPRRVLFQRIEFATAVNPMARIAYGLYQGKFLHAVSVGFIPLRWEMGSEGSDYRRKFVEQELLEVSAVGIPANPEALALGLKAGAVEKSDLRELLELLRESLDPGNFGSQLAAPHPDTGALGARSDEAQLLQLARELRNALKQ
jgi:HK97 family phage prohead protease